MTEAAKRHAWGALDEIFSSARPLAYIRTSEEGRVVGLVRAAAAGAFPAPVPLWIWSLTEGMRRDGAGDASEPLGPREALDFVARHEGPALVLLKDFHEHIRESPEIRRRLRDLYDACFDRGKFVMICSPVKELPDEIAHHVVFIDLPVPGVDELTDFARREAEAVVAAGGTADTSDATAAPGGPRAAGADLRRGAARHPARALRAQCARRGVAAGIARGEARARESHGHDRVPALDHRHRRHRRSRNHEAVAARPAQAVPDASRAERRDRPEGRARHGHLGLREEPRHQGDRLVLRPAALPHRHGRGLLRPPRQAGSGIRAGVPPPNRSHLVAWFDEIEAGTSSTQAKKASSAGCWVLLTWMQGRRAASSWARPPAASPAACGDDPQGRFDGGVLRGFPLDDEGSSQGALAAPDRSRGIQPRATQKYPGLDRRGIEQCVVSALTTVSHRMSADGQGPAHYRQRRPAVEDHEGAGRADPELGFRPRRARVAARGRALSGSSRPGEERCSPPGRDAGYVSRASRARCPGTPGSARTGPCSTWWSSCSSRWWRRPWTWSWSRRGS